MREQIEEWLDLNAYPIGDLGKEQTFEEWKKESAGEILALMTKVIKKGLLSDAQMGEVKFDMGSPWGGVDRYTVGKAIAQHQVDEIVLLVNKEVKCRR